MTPKESYDKAKALCDKAEKFIDSKSVEASTNKSVCGPATSDLYEATSILTDAIVSDEKPAPPDELLLLGLRAECYSDMATWEVGLVDSKDAAEKASYDLDKWLSFTGQNQSDIDHAKFLKDRMQLIINYKGNGEKSPNWSAMVNGGKLAFLDDSIPATDYTIPIAIGIGVILLAGAAIAVKHHAAVTAHAALTANPAVFVWKKHYEKHNCYDGNFHCGSVYYDLNYNKWVASPRIGIESVHSSMKSAKARIESNWSRRS